MSKLLSVYVFTNLLGQFDVKHNSTGKFHLYNTLGITPILRITTYQLKCL